MHFAQGHKANRQCALDLNSGNVGPKPRLLIPKPRCLSVFFWSHKGNGQRQVHIWVKSQNRMMGVCAQSCPTLCSPMDCSLPGSSVHGISQARILEWVATSFSRGSSWPRGRTCVSWSFALAGGFFSTGKPHRMRNLSIREGKENFCCCCCCQIASVVSDCATP